MFELFSHLCPALVRLVDEYLRHPLDGDGEGDHRVLALVAFLWGKSHEEKV